MRYVTTPIPGTPVVRAWEEEWWMLAARVGDEIGALMNAPRGSFACLQNVTTCEATVASCLDFSRRRNKVVYTDLNFPSIMNFSEAERIRGAHGVMFPNDDAVHLTTERLLDVLDDETLIVPIAHVIVRSAFIQDVAAIVEKAYRVGAYVLLDSFQAQARCRPMCSSSTSPSAREACSGGCAAGPARPICTYVPIWRRS